MSKKQPLSPLPKPQNETKKVLADKIKAQTTGSIILKGSPKSPTDKYFDSMLKTGSF